MYLPSCDFGGSNTGSTHKKLFKKHIKSARKQARK
jgi:hypothetical protein